MQILMFLCVMLNGKKDRKPTHAMRSQNFLSTCIYIFKLLILCRENLSVSGNKMVMVLKVCFGFFLLHFPSVLQFYIFFILPLHSRRIFFLIYLF